MRVRIDPEACFHCGLCAEIAPAVFEIHRVEVRAAFERVPAGMERSILEAAASCPRGAIWLAEVQRESFAT
jgi:ferredoxin